MRNTHTHTHIHTQMHSQFNLSLSFPLKVLIKKWINGLFIMSAYLIAAHPQPVPLWLCAFTLSVHIYTKIFSLPSVLRIVTESISSLYNLIYNLITPSPILL